MCCKISTNFLYKQEFRHKIVIRPPTSTVFIIRYVVIFIFIYELLSIGGLGKSKTKRAESPMTFIAQGNALGKRIQSRQRALFYSN